MNIELLFKWIMALPAMLLPGGDRQAPSIGIYAPAPAAQQQEQAQAPKATPTTQKRVRTSTPSPVAKATPVTRATPVPKATPAAAATELASEAVCPGQADPAKTAEVLVCLSSHARAYHKLGPVAADPALMEAAAAKNQDMQACGYGHTACGHEFNYWIEAKGYDGRCMAENIAKGQQTPRIVFEAWMKSPGHRANILNPDYNEIGVAQLSTSTGRLWTMHLGGC